MQIWVVTVLDGTKYGARGVKDEVTKDERSRAGKGRSGGEWAEGLSKWLLVEEERRLRGGVATDKIFR